ncbi:succinate dehydrogenase assembly factor 2 [Thalassobaculum litoreum]|uniref:FAD assembly factor SdhE n=1 Tax=Thalassobaculum litoreum DSM 18839 TaxID=1123362 RepID=A0A8G2BDZ6_9PROT|nr:succinate dehydrogenase assembly factor 2 [Thalassobaculum litoreum]SDF09392.1 antitoxin CptB [Thalassobaculum litoreum DSM 18839]
MTEALDARRKRLRYRSTYTGTKETDLLLGAFADRHLGSLSDSDLDDYEHLLSIEDPRLYTWITGQETPPAEFDTPVLQMLRDFKLTQA